MTDDDRVEEIRARAGAYHERLCERGMCATIRAEEYCLDIERLLAQYDALKAENGKLREAAIRTLQLYQLYDVAKLAGQDISKECVGFLIEAASEACRVLGKPWGFWREGGR